MDNDFIEDQLVLEYYGPAVEMGRMNSYDVASYILAFSDYLGVASRTAYGERIELRTEIQGFRGNSFDIIFVLQIAGIAYTLIAPSTPFTVKDFIGLIKDSIQAFLHLNGKPPKSMKSLPEENKIMVENHIGEINYFHGDVINIVKNARAGKAVEQFIRRPLETGVKGVKIKSEKVDLIAELPEEVAPFFIPVDFETPLTENEVTVWLLIESPTFKEGNKWRFSDGETSFFTSILDEEFLKKVNSGEERFGKGDRLLVLMRQSQSGTLTGFKFERNIIKVLEHQIPIKPNGLFK